MKERQKEKITNWLVAKLGRLYTYIPDTTVYNVHKIFFLLTQKKNNNKFTYFMGKVKLFYYGY